VLAHGKERLPCTFYRMHDKQLPLSCVFKAAHGKQSSLPCACVKTHGKESLPDPRTHPDPLVRRGPFHQPTFPPRLYIDAPHANPNPPSPSPSCVVSASPSPSCRSSPSLVVAVSPLISIPRSGRTGMQGRAPNPGCRGGPHPPAPAEHPRRGAVGPLHVELVTLLSMAGHGKRWRPSSSTRWWRPELPRAPLPLSPATAALPMPPSLPVGAGSGEVGWDPVVAGVDPTFSPSTTSSSPPGRVDPRRWARWLDPAVRADMVAGSGLGGCGAPPAADPAAWRTGLTAASIRRPPPLQRHRLTGRLFSDQPRQVPPPLSLSLSLSLPPSLPPSHCFSPSVHSQRRVVAAAGAQHRRWGEGAEESKPRRDPSVADMVVWL
jgi:hypothetical protein